MLKRKRVTREPSADQQAVAVCRKVFSETQTACEEAGESRIMARLAASDAALANLPLLDSVQNIKAHVVCIGWMLQNKMMSGAEAKAHLYAAQCALVGIGRVRE